MAASNQVSEGREAGPAGGLETLPAGKHGLSRAQVRANQRARLVAASAQALRESGLTGLNVRVVCELACVSRKTFYELFKDKERCLAATCEESRRLLARAAGGGKPAALALQALLGEVAREPELAEVFVLWGAAIDGGRTYCRGLRELGAALGGAGGPRREFIAAGTIGALAELARRGELSRAPELDSELGALVAACAAPGSADVGPP